MAHEYVTQAYSQDLPSAEKFVLVVLCDRADQDGRCWPSQADLARMTGMGQRTVRRHLEALESRGLIVRHERRAAGGSRRSDYFQITFCSQAAKLAGSENQGHIMSQAANLAGSQAANLAGSDIICEPSDIYNIYNNNIYNNIPPISPKKSRARSKAERPRNGEHADALNLLPENQSDPWEYAGAVIKLRQSDWMRWLSLCDILPGDLWDLLDSRDRWLATQPEAAQQRWFISTERWLAKRFEWQASESNKKSVQTEAIRG